MSSVRAWGPAEAAKARTLIARFHGISASGAIVAQALADPANLLLVAEAGEEILGFAWCHWLTRLGHDRPQLFLYELEVDEAHRRKGIGTELVQAVLDEARGRQAKAFVFTNHSNLAARALYARMGGRIKNPGGDDLLFVFPFAEG